MVKKTPKVVEPVKVVELPKEEKKRKRAKRLIPKTPLDNSIRKWGKKHDIRINEDVMPICSTNANKFITNVAEVMRRNLGPHKTVTHKHAVYAVLTVLGSQTNLARKALEREIATIRRIEASKV